jgi:hypothetical protein
MDSKNSKSFISGVWKYFEKDENDENYSICQYAPEEDPDNKCFKRLKNDKGTTGMWKHIEHKHNINRNQCPPGKALTNVGNFSL